MYVTLDYLMSLDQKNAILLTFLGQTPLFLVKKHKSGSVEVLLNLKFGVHFIYKKKVQQFMQHGGH